MKIGDKEYKLKYNNRALFKAEKQCNVAIIDIMNTPEVGNRIEVHAALIWAGIDDVKMTFDEFIDTHTPAEIVNAAQEILPLIVDAFTTGEGSSEKVKKNGTPEQVS